MRQFKVPSLVLIGSVFGIASLGYAQQPSADPAKPPSPGIGVPAAASAAPPGGATPAPAAVPAPATAPAAAVGTAPIAAAAGPDPDTLKKAKNAGFHPEVTKAGATVYCREDAEVGSRFKKKRCVDADGLHAYLDENQVMQDQLHRGMTSGPSSK